jgi:hypothetical protein
VLEKKNAEIDALKQEKIEIAKVGEALLQEALNQIEEKDRKIAEITKRFASIISEMPSQSLTRMQLRTIEGELRALIQKPEEKKPFSCTTGRSFLPPKKPEEKKVK